MIAADARPDALLTGEALAAVLDVGGATVVALDRDEALIADLDGSDLETTATMTDPEYVIYTSGSQAGRKASRCHTWRSRTYFARCSSVPASRQRTNSWP